MPCARILRPAFLLVTLVTVACGGSADSSSPGDAATDALRVDGASEEASTHDATPGDATEADAPPTDAGAGPLTPCPTSGSGAFVLPGTTCTLLTPAQTGASASGKNAGVPSYAITPQVDAGARGELLLWLNGSGGSPGGPEVLTDPTQNFYAAAASLGYSVFGVSYASTASIGSLCKGVDSCFFPTRKAVILGVAQPGAASEVASITLDQGIVDRLVLALHMLRTQQPSQGWGAFLASDDTTLLPEQQIAWNKIAVAGHSQGGGHAAVIGKLFAVPRVVQLSAPCDDSNGMPASWTAASNGPWASDPSQFYGLAAPSVFTGSTPTSGDTTCPYHLANWQNLGMTASHQDDDAATCGDTGDTHPESCRCAQNYPEWQAMLK
jgi:hypothetical protein